MYSAYKTHTPCFKLRYQQHSRLVIFFMHWPASLKRGSIVPAICYAERHSQKGYAHGHTHMFSGSLVIYLRRNRQLIGSVNSGGWDIKHNAMWRQEGDSVPSRRLDNSEAAWNQAHFIRECAHNLKTRYYAVVPANKDNNCCWTYWTMRDECVEAHERKKKKATYEDILSKCRCNAVKWPP